MFIVLGGSNYVGLEGQLNYIINNNLESSYKIQHLETGSDGYWIVFMDKQPIDPQNPLDRVGEFKVIRAQNRNEIEEFEDNLNTVDITKGWKAEAYCLHGPLVVFSRNDKAKAVELGIKSVEDYIKILKSGCRSLEEYDKFQEFKGRIQQNFNEINADAEVAFTEKRFGEYIRLKYLAFEKIAEALVKQLTKNEKQEVQDLVENLHQIRGRFHQSITDLPELVNWRNLRNQIVHENLKPTQDQAEKAKMFFDTAIQIILHMSSKVPWRFDHRDPILDKEEFPEPQNEESWDEFDDLEDSDSDDDE